MRSALLALLGPLLAACSVTRETVVPVIDASRVRLEVDPDGPWHENHFREASAPADLRPPAPPVERPLLARAMPPSPAAPALAPLPVPAARGTGRAAPKGAAPAKPLAQVARERFLDHPTEIEADQITLYLPAALVGEARLTGADVNEPTPGRRQALGGARLTCRELTLRAERLTLRTQDASADLRITAKGAVRFVSRQHDQVVREEGLRSLLITNDQLTPLR